MLLFKKMLPSRKFEQGLIDPLSLFALGFLVVSLFVGTAVVSNPNFSLDIRERAREIGEETVSVVRKTTPSAHEKTPTKTPTAAPERDLEEERTERKEESLESQIAQITPTLSPTAGPTPTPYCSRFNQENCLFGCEPNATGGKCNTVSATPTPSPTVTSTTATTPPSPTVTPYCSRFNQENCLYGCDSTITGGTCRAGRLTPTPVPTSLTPTPTPYCSRFFNDNCIYGCEPTSSGGKCRTTPSLTPVPTATMSPGAATATSCISADGRAGTCKPGNLCTGDFESAGLAGCTPETATRIIAAAPVCCVAKPPEAEVTPSTPDRYAQEAFASSDSSVGEQIEADLNYILFSPTSSFGTRLWAAADILTLGGLTNYGQTYAEVNQEQTDSSYLERAFSTKGVGASARLGATLVGEFGGGAVALDALTGGAATLEAYTGAQATLQTTLSNAPSWVVPTLRYGGVVLGNLGVLQGLRACQDDPSSDLCAATIVSGQLGMLDDLARETGNVLDEIGQSASRLATRSVQEVPVAQALSQAVEPPSLSPSSSRTVTLDTGEVISVGEQVGSAGGQGAAYIGTRCTGETCIVKLIDDIGGNIDINAEQLRIMRQYATAQQISQGIPLPEYYGSIVGSEGQSVGYAMQYVPGQTMREIIEAQGGITTEQATSILDAVSTYQRRTGVVHGDVLQTNPYLGTVVSTGNIFITPEGSALLIDPIGTSYAQRTVTEEFELLQRALQHFIVP